MKAEILEFYESLNVPISKMIDIGVGRKGLSADSIKAAAVEVYDEIQAGETCIPKIRTAWEIFARARTIKADVEKKESEAIESLMAQIEKQSETIGKLKDQISEYAQSLARRGEMIRQRQEEIEYLKLPWWKKLMESKKHE